MKGMRAAFFNFASIYRKKIPVNDEICSKTSTKMEYNGNQYKYRNLSPYIFRQKSPVKVEQRE